MYTQYFDVYSTYYMHVWLFVAFKLKWINLKGNYLKFNACIHQILQCLTIQFNSIRFDINQNGEWNGAKRQTNYKSHISKKTNSDNVFSPSLLITITDCFCCDCCCIQSNLHYSWKCFFSVSISGCTKSISLASAHIDRLQIRRWRHDVQHTMILRMYCNE